MQSKTTILILTFPFLFLGACASNKGPRFDPHPNSQAAFDYIKALKGNWTVDGGKEGTFGWNFDVTSRDKIILERLKVGTPAEMTTVYHLEDARLFADHYCQLGNQPHLSAVTMDAEGDLHFICDGNVGSTKSHAELHMHGVHFKKTKSGVRIWMDMHKDGKLAFENSYNLVRAKH